MDALRDVNRWVDNCQRRMDVVGVVGGACLVCKVLWWRWLEQWLVTSESESHHRTGRTMVKPQQVTVWEVWRCGLKGEVLRRIWGGIQYSELDKVPSSLYTGWILNRSACVHPATAKTGRSLWICIRTLKSDGNNVMKAISLHANDVLIHWWVILIRLSK